MAVMLRPEAVAVDGVADAIWGSAMLGAAAGCIDPAGLGGV
jgi:hypothetical protein